MKQLIHKFLARFGLELRRLGPTGRNRATQQAGLQIALQNGLQVNSVIDVGAAFGDWTRMCRSLIPNAEYLLVEPLPQYDKWLDSLLAEQSDITRLKAAAAGIAGQATFFLHDDWVGSSLYTETEGAIVNGTPLEVDTITVDDIVRQHELSAPFLLKIDVQGAELQVLQGATNTLPQTEYLLVETSLFQFFRDGPLIHELIAYMREQGFVIYDILDYQYRLLDNALGQVDLAFVPEKSRLRKEHVYASPDQRREQTKQFKQVIKHRK